MALSERGKQFSQPDPSSLLWDILQDLWTPDQNPNGYVSLGVAENTLMHDALDKHLHQHIAVPQQAFTYGDGGKQMKASISRFLNRQLRPVVPIEPSHITYANGCSSAIEHLAWALGNPGDVFLLGQPYYGTFVMDVTARFGTQLAKVAFDKIDPLGMAAVAKYEERILKAQAEGQRVAGLIISHPHNPLGRCYSREVLVELMRLCEKYSIHFVSDEIYALSTFVNRVDGGEYVPFESALTIDPRGIIDPALVHVVWGMSKDFGANGLRIGCIISQRNPALHSAIMPVSLYTSTSSVSEHITSNALSDDAWVDWYIKQNQSKLADQYEHVTTWARQHGIEYAPGVNAAFFLWVDLGKYYQKTHPEETGNLDQVVMDALLKHKVFLASGVVFGSEQPGWFRIVFSQHTDYLDEGLRRVIAAIEG